MVAFLYIIFVVLTSLTPLRSVILGGIPFWHDPARDMLLAVANLHKLTLIGPPGGLPGIFYGPYWIWLLSLPMILTHNPRIVTLLAITIPYLIFFPLLLWKLKQYFGPVTIFIFWALFISNFDNYVTFPWSPYPVALLFLVLAYLVVKNKSVFLIGVVSALTPNFNFSFGITVIFATAVFQLFSNIRKFPLFLAGVVLVYSPLLLFEFRHNFLQIHAFIDAFIKSALFNTAVVGQMGMSKGEIFPQLLKAAADVVHLPVKIFAPVGFILLVLIAAKGLLKDRLVVFLFCCLGSLLIIYFSTKNPVWPYYFIGTETIFLLLLGRLMSKSRIVTLVLGVFAAYLFITTSIHFFAELRPKYLAVPSLASKESIARLVIADSSKTPFQIFAYSPSLYTYDYDYLFGWLKAQTDPEAQTTYLIIPPTSEATHLDFVHYRTPDKIYRTIWEKTMPDGTVVIKRLKTI